MQGRPKPVQFHGTAREDMRKFPDEAKKEMGYQIHRLQHGLDPVNYKDMNSVGPGAREIRIRCEDGIFRTIYVAKFDDKIHILHAFQKKTQKTSKNDIKLAKERYKTLKRYI